VNRGSGGRRGRTTFADRLRAQARGEGRHGAWLTVGGQATIKHSEIVACWVWWSDSEVVQEEVPVMCEISPNKICCHPISKPSLTVFVNLKSTRCCTTFGRRREMCQHYHSRGFGFEWSRMQNKLIVTGCQYHILDLVFRYLLDFFLFLRKLGQLQVYWWDHSSEWWVAKHILSQQRCLSTRTLDGPTILNPFWAVWIVQFLPKRGEMAANQMVQTARQMELMRIFCINCLFLPHLKLFPHLNLKTHKHAIR